MTPNENSAAPSNRKFCRGCARYSMLKLRRTYWSRHGSYMGRWEGRDMRGYELLKFRAFSIVAGGTIQCAVPDCPTRSLLVLHLDHIYNDGCKQRKKHSK